MAAPQPVTSDRVYVEAGAADAFARRLLVAHGVPDADAAIVAACLVSAESTPMGSPACPAISTACAAD